MKRAVWLVLGFLFLGIGAVGIVLPLLPTVPFLLLTAFCFARASERLHHWLINHNTFGPPIADWQERGAIGRKAKLLATASIGAAFVVPFLVGVSAKILAIQVVVLSCVLVFIWTRPEH